ncbi:ATP-binding cassette domain-containing protein [Blautia wexlerae]|uniref:ATP-binding cassette domain-containing protein n=1 Tax=Blautia wexlerae TaxID=418240 RepID=UPI00325A8684
MLEIKNLTKIYPNGKKAVSDLNITIEDGDLYGFIGKNGAGKTTTLKACLTIHDYDTGDILLNGVSIKSAPTECKKLMAYILFASYILAFLFALLTMLIGILLKKASKTF